MGGGRRGADNYLNNWRPFDTMYIWLQALRVKFREHNGVPDTKPSRGVGGMESLNLDSHHRDELKLEMT